MWEKLKRNVNNWRAIGCSETIIDWINYGVPLCFESTPDAYIQGNNDNMSIDDVTFVDEQISVLESQGAIRRCSLADVHCVSPIKCIGKKHGSKRFLVNLYRLNQHIATPKFRYEGISAVSEQILTGDILYSADLKDGFFHVPVQEADQKFLGICWKGVYYVWCVLPQGLACSPYYFYKVLRPVVQYLREQGLRLTLWVDDFLLMCARSVATDHKDLLIHTLRDLGWTINFEKSDFNDNTVCSYIGYHINSQGPDGVPWLKVNSTRVAKVTKDIRRCLSETGVSVRRIARVAGQCISMIKAVLPGKLLLQCIYKFIAHRVSWDDKVLLPYGVINELRWWADALQTWNGAPLRVRTVDCQISTDASGTGWGACLGEAKASGLWTTWVSHMPSNFRELLAVAQAIKSFGPRLQHLCVQVLTDNITTVACINKLYSPSSQMGQLAQSVWVEANKWNIELRAKYLAGKLNTEADALSRITSPYEWKLNPRVFNKLDRRWGPHTIDRCASLMTTQLPSYNSLFHDPHTKGVDCLAQQDWALHNNYVNPPFWLIPQILSVIQAQQAEATIIAPMWPAQPWFQTLVDLVVDWPMPVVNTSKNIQALLTVPEPRKNVLWKLYAWRISGRRN